MKLFIDDMRVPVLLDKRDWNVIREYNAAKKILLSMPAERHHLSLDHGMGLWQVDGIQFMNWLEEMVYTGKLICPETIVVHSQNPEMRRKMQLIAERILSWPIPDKFRKI